MQRRRAMDLAQVQAADGAAGAQAQADPAATLPASLTRRYEVHIHPRTKAATSKLREVSASQVGHLVKFKVGGRDVTYPGLKHGSSWGNVRCTPVFSVWPLPSRTATNLVAVDKKNDIRPCVRNICQGRCLGSSLCRRICMLLIWRRGRQACPTLPMPASTPGQSQYFDNLPSTWVSCFSQSSTKASWPQLLVVLQGIVTQVGDVRPLLTVATYLDDQTGYEIYQEVRSDWSLTFRLL